MFEADVNLGYPLSGVYMKSLVYWVILIALVGGALCVAAPEPAMLQTGDQWTLNIKYENPEQIEIKLPGDKHPMRFWYLIVTLTNKTGRDADFYPKCELMTDTYQIIPAGKFVPDAVFEQIKKRHRGQYPLLESLEKKGNKILQGDDNAQDIAIVWHDFDPAAKGIKLFLSGLSNETAVIDSPLAKDQAGNPEKIYLRKTLELNYSLGGDPTFRSDAKLVFKSKSWIMR